MLTRRDPSAADILKAARPPLLPGHRPLRAEPRSRRILPRPQPGGLWLMETDAPSRPRPVVRPEVIDRVFGAGTHDTLGHPDHWRMIDAGWFTGADLHLPVPPDDEAYLHWRAHHHPAAEAHDILAALFGKRAGRRWRGARLSNGLTLWDDGGCPRHATARVHSDRDLLQVAEEVAQMDLPLEIVLPDAVLPLLD